MRDTERRAAAGLPVDDLYDLFTLPLSPWTFAQLCTHKHTEDNEQATLRNSSAFCLAKTMLPSKKSIEPSARDDSRESQPFIPTEFAHLIGGDITEKLVLQVLGMMIPEQMIDVKESDIAGLEAVRKVIRDKIINPFRRPDLHKGLHMAAKGILLFGPPGTGKTMLAKWIASDARASFFNVSPANLISKYYGETESLAKSLFLCAEAVAPSVVFIDEIDALLGKRKDGDDDTGIRMKNQLLALMEGLSKDENKAVVVIGATNRPQSMDAAAIRRFPRRVLVPLPDSAARAGIIQQLLQEHHRTQGSNDQFSHESALSVAQLLDGWSGSDVKELCVKAADCAYDDAMKEFGDVDAIPPGFCFRAVRYDDFARALKSARPAATADLTEILAWAQLHGAI